MNIKAMTLSQLAELYLHSFDFLTTDRFKDQYKLNDIDLAHMKRAYELRQMNIKAQQSIQAINGVA